jgi:hypothetical protein
MFYSHLQGARLQTNRNENVLITVKAAILTNDRYPTMFPTTVIAGSFTTLHMFLKQFPIVRIISLRLAPKILPPRRQQDTNVCIHFLVQEANGNFWAFDRRNGTSDSQENPWTTSNDLVAR